MIICISGLTGCGKNTVGEIVAETLGLRQVNPTFKTIAEKEKVSLMDFQKKAEGEHKIDKDFDVRLIEEVGNGNCVVTTWLGPWMVKNADLRVWLHAPKEERARRIAKRDGMNEKEALSHLSERDEGNRKRYMSVYGIDIYEHSGFDLEIDSGKMTPEQSAAAIVEAARKKAGKKVAGKKK